MDTLEDILAREYPFRVDVDAEDGGYLVRFPDLPGCMTVSATLEDIPVMARDARDLWITSVYERGRPVPHPGDYNNESMPAGWEPRDGTAAADGGVRHLTTSDVAARLGVSVRRVQALAAQRSVGKRFGRDLLFSNDEVESMRPGQVGRPRRVAV